MDLHQLKERIENVGLAGERKAIALLFLGFYTTLFSINALFSPLPEWTSFFLGLAICWGVAFFALAASWFWGRWFAVGLGNFGWTTAAWVMLKAGVNGPILVFGAMHAIIAVMLLGNQMAAQYELRADWRDRFHLDEQGVMKVRRAVTWAATSLPVLIMMALSPRGDEEGLLVLAAVGLYGVLRGRTWGVLALGGAGVAALVTCWFTPAGVLFAMPTIAPMAMGTLAFVAGSLLCGAALPFVGPILAHLRPQARA